MNKLPIGTKLYTYDFNEFEIISVGVKYYTVKREWQEYKVSIDNLKHEVKNYSQRSIQFYLTMQEIEDKKAFADLYKFISSEFRNSNYYTFTLEQLRQIKAIIS